jgi:hypothetical protein
VSSGLDENAYEDEIEEPLDEDFLPEHQLIITAKLIGLTGSASSLSSGVSNQYTHNDASSLVSTPSTANSNNNIPEEPDSPEDSGPLIVAPKLIPLERNNPVQQQQQPAESNLSSSKQQQQQQPQQTTAAKKESRLTSENIASPDAPQSPSPTPLHSSRIMTGSSSSSKPVITSNTG